MFVLPDLRPSARRSRLFALALSVVILAMVAQSRLLQAQVDQGPQTQEQLIAPVPAPPSVEEALWSETVERYQVVLLSRGLLLEPLDQSVELRTIELGEGEILVDGRLVGEAELRDKLGDAEADLILRLAAMPQPDRRRVFGGDRSGLAESVPEPPERPAEPPPVDQETEPDRRPERRYTDAQVVVGDSLTIDADEVAREAVVFGGRLVVDGKVAGDAAAIGGSVTVRGEVSGDVVAVGGSVVLEPGAEILGDAVSVGGEIEVDEAARVAGQIIEVPFGPSLQFGAWPSLFFKKRHGWDRDEWFDLTPWGVATSVMWQAFGLLVLVLLAFLALLIARRPMERIRQRATTEPWKSGLVGLVTEILVLPVFLLLCLVLVISIIGIPLVLLLPFAFLALVLMAFVGFCGVALGVGGFLQDRFGWRRTSPYLTLLLGLAAIQIWSLIGDLFDFGWGPLWFFALMFGIFGVLIKYAAWTVGLGAAILTRFGTAGGWGRDEQLPLPPRPPSPAEPALDVPPPTPPADLPPVEELAAQTGPEEPEPGNESPTRSGGG